jgi:hypothetical protein
MFNTPQPIISTGTRMLPVRKLNQEHTFEATVNRIGLDKLSRDLGQNNLPDTKGKSPDQYSQFILDEAKAGANRFAEANSDAIDAAEKQIEGLMPTSINCEVELLSGEAQARKIAATLWDDLVASFRRMTASDRDRRAFMAERSISRQANYQRDPWMFVLVTFALVLLDGMINAYFFRDVSDDGLLGGMVVAALMSGITVMLGLVAGTLGWRLMRSHQLQWMRWSGGFVLAITVLVAVMLNVLFAHFRDALATNPDATFRDAAAILHDPNRWFRLNETSSYLMVAVGLIVFLAAFVKGRGGDHHLGAPWDTIWGYAAVDQAYIRAHDEFQLKCHVYRQTLVQIFEAVGQTAVGKLGRIERECQAILDTIRDTERVHEAIANGRGEWLNTAQRVWKRFWETNSSVRTNAVPAYSATAPDFASSFPQLEPPNDLRSLGRAAEEVLKQSREQVLSVQRLCLERVQTMVEQVLRDVQQMEEREGKNLVGSTMPAWQAQKSKQTSKVQP